MDKATLYQAQREMMRGVVTEFTLNPCEAFGLFKILYDVHLELVCESAEEAFILAGLRRRLRTEVGKLGPATKQMADELVNYHGGK